MNAKILLTFLGIGAAATVATVATTDRHDETQYRLEQDTITAEEPVVIIQNLEGGFTEEYPSLEDAAIISGESQIEIFNDIILSTAGDSTTFEEKEE